MEAERDLLQKLLTKRDDEGDTRRIVRDLVANRSGDGWLEVQRITLELESKEHQAQRDKARSERTLQYMHDNEQVSETAIAALEKNLSSYTNDLLRTREDLSQLKVIKTKLELDLERAEFLLKDKNDEDSALATASRIGRVGGVGDFDPQGETKGKPRRMKPQAAVLVCDGDFNKLAADPEVMRVRLRLRLGSDRVKVRPKH